LAASYPGQQEQTYNQSTPAGVPEGKITGSLGERRATKRSKESKTVAVGSGNRGCVYMLC